MPRPTSRSDIIPLSHQNAESGRPSGRPLVRTDHQALPSPADSLFCDVFGQWRGRRTRTMGRRGTWICDEPELERQVAQHWLLRILLGYPFLAPCVHDILRPDVQGLKVLDIATGTGIWAIDMADMFPQAKVIGVDSAPIQQLMVPPNCEFELANIDRGLPYHSGSFDVIHLRFAHLRVSSYTALVSAAWRLLRVGGVLLIFDYSGPPTTADNTEMTGMQAWTDALYRSGRAAGVEPFCLERIMSVLHGCEVSGSDVCVPLGHGKGKMDQLGKIHLVNVRVYLETARHLMVAHGGYTDAEVDVLSEACLSDVYHFETYIRYHALTVRKCHAY